MNIMIFPDNDVSTNYRSLQECELLRLKSLFPAFYFRFVDQLGRIPVFNDQEFTPTKYYIKLSDLESTK